jgi:hypothetical protein
VAGEVTPTVTMSFHDKKVGGGYNDNQKGGGNEWAVCATRMSGTSQTKTEQTANVTCEAEGILQIAACAERRMSQACVTVTGVRHIRNISLSDMKGVFRRKSHFM